MNNNDFEGNPLYENVLLALRSYNIYIPSTRGLKMSDNDISFESIKSRIGALKAAKANIDTALQCLEHLKNCHVKFLEDRTRKLVAKSKKK